MKNNKIIFYDLETYKLRMGKKKTKYGEKPYIKRNGKITSIVLIDKDTQETQSYTIGVNVESEGELLAEIRDIFLNKENILCAWNGNGFDDIIIRKKLGIGYNDESCRFFDLMEGYGKFILNNKDTRVSLSKVAEDIGSFKLANMPPETLYQRKKYDKLQEYNIQDVKALSIIDEEYSLTQIMLGLLDKTGLSYPNQVFGVTKPLESYINKENIVLGTCKSKEKILNTGGLNFMKGHQFENLKHFDVSSYYPNMFISLNASSNLKYDNIKYYTVKELPADVTEISKSFWVTRNGLTQIRAVHNSDKTKISYYKVAELTRNFDVSKGNGDISSLTKKLLHYKETTTGNERNTYKVLVNGLYGALDSEYFEYEHQPLSAAATFLCRYVLVNIIDKFNAVYGKTDSIWSTDTSLTEEKLDEYTNYLLDCVGLPRTSIHWELESEPEELFIKDYNNYVEVIDGVSKFKGAFNTPIQKKVIDEVIKTGQVNPEYYYNKYIDDIPLFCKYVKYSKKVGNYTNNTVIANLKQYNFEDSFKAYKYYSRYGNVLNEVNNMFDLPVNKEYALSQITSILQGYGFIDDKIDFNQKKIANEPVIIPGYFNKENGRILINKQEIYRLLKIKNPPKTLKISELIQLNMDYQGKYKLLVTGNNPLGNFNYYQIDIDRKDFGDNTDIVKDNILTVFNKGNYVLQSTKSNGYHIFFKSKEDCTHFKPISEVEGYEGLEFKYNTVTPYDCGNYEIIHGDIFSIKSFNTIDKLNQFFTVKDNPENSDTETEELTINNDLTIKNEYIKPLTKAINNINGKGIINRDFIPGVIGYYARNGIDIRETLIEAFRQSKDNDEHRILEIRGYGLSNTGKGYATLKNILKPEILKELELIKETINIETINTKEEYEKWLNREIKDNISIGTVLENYPVVKESIEYHIGQKELTVDFKHKSKNNIIFNSKELNREFYKIIHRVLADDNGEVKDKKTLNTTVKSLTKLIETQIQAILNKQEVLSFDELVTLFKETYPKFEYKNEQELYQVIEMIILLGANMNTIQELVMASGGGKGVRMEILKTIFNNIIVMDDFTAPAFIRNCVYDSYFYNNQIVIAPDMGAHDESNNKMAIDKVIKPLVSDNRYDDYKATSNPHSEGTTHTRILVPDGFKFVYMIPSQLIINNQVSARTHRIRTLNTMTREDARNEILNGTTCKLSNNVQPFRFAMLKKIQQINTNINNDTLPSLTDKEVDDLLKYMEENNNGTYNNHMLDSFPLIIRIFKILYGDDFNKNYFKPTITDNNLLRKPALKLFDEFIKTWIKPHDPQLREHTIAKTTSTYAHKSEYDYDCFNIIAIQGIRRTWIKQRKGMIAEYLNWLVNNGYLAIHDKVQGKNIYCYYQNNDE